MVPQSTIMWNFNTVCPGVARIEQCNCFFNCSTLWAIFKQMFFSVGGLRCTWSAADESPDISAIHYCFASKLDPKVEVSHEWLNVTHLWTCLTEICSYSSYLNCVPKNWTHPFCWRHLCHILTADQNILPRQACLRINPSDTYAPLVLNIPDQSLNIRKRPCPSLKLHPALTVRRPRTTPPHKTPHPSDVYCQISPLDKHHHHASHATTLCRCPLHYPTWDKSRWAKLLDEHPFALDAPEWCPLHIPSTHTTPVLLPLLRTNVPSDVNPHNITLLG